MSDQPKRCGHPGCTRMGLMTFPGPGGSVTDHWLCEQHLDQLIYNPENVAATPALEDLEEFRDGGGQPS